MIAWVFTGAMLLVLVLVLVHVHHLYEQLADACTALEEARKREALAKREEKKARDRLRRYQQGDTP